MDELNGEGWFYKAVRTRICHRVKPTMRKEFNDAAVGSVVESMCESWVRRSSLFAPARAGVVYIPNKMVYPHEWLRKEQYGLTVFDTRKHLNEFVGKQGFVPSSYEVWACRVENPRWLYEEKSRLERYYICTERRLDQFLFNTCCTREGRKWPEGTVMCDGVKLVYCIERHNGIEDKFPVVQW